MSMNQPEGFTFLERKSGVVEIRHFGRLAVLLRGHHAEKFLARAAGASELEIQHHMARATGNYKRGNERKRP